MRCELKNVHCFPKNMSSDLQINAFLFAAVLGELAMVAFALLMVFEIYSINWWAILLNAWQLVFVGGFLSYLFNDILSRSEEIRNFVTASTVSSLLLVIGHSIVQISLGRSDSEEISAHSHSKLFQPYSNLSSTRITVFVLISFLALNAIFFRKVARK